MLGYTSSSAPVRRVSLTWMDVVGGVVGGHVDTAAGRRDRPSGRFCRWCSCCEPPASWLKPAVEPLAATTTASVVEEAEPAKMYSALPSAPKQMVTDWPVRKVKSSP